jgi:prolyl-tRNA synthetase
MADEKLPSRKDDFAEWYNQLVPRAELADYAPVRGCMNVRPCPAQRSQHCHDIL